MARKARKQSNYGLSSSFVDRNEQRNLFWNVYNSLRSNEYDVLSFYGIGGSGKSSLLLELVKEMKDKNLEKNNIYLCLDHCSSKEIIIRSLTVAIKEKNNKATFPLVDAAIAKIESSRKRITDRFQGKKGIFEAGDISDVVGLGAGVISLIPGAGTYVATAFQTLGFAAKKIIERKGRKLFKQIDNKGQQYLNEIEARDCRYAIDMLHIFFLEDIWSFCEERTEPLVIFIDGYDEYVNRGRDGEVANFDDNWIYNETSGLINLPNTIWVISGRNMLSWWPENILCKENIQEISDFSEYYTNEFLNNAGITNKGLIDHIYLITHGTPVYLELCVNTYKSIKSRESREPSSDDFGHNTNELVNRFMENLHPEARKLLIMISCLPIVWEKALAIETAKTLGYGRVEETLQDLLSLSMFNEHSEGWQLHSTVRDVIRANFSEVDRIDVEVMAHEKEQLFSSRHIDSLRKHLINFVEMLLRCDRYNLSQEEVGSLFVILSLVFESEYDYLNYEKYIVLLIEYAERHDLPIELLIRMRNGRSINLHRLGYNREYLNYSEETYKNALIKLGEKDETTIDSLAIYCSAIFFKQDYKKASEYYESYMNLASKTNDKSVYLDSLYNYALIHYSLGKKDIAFDELSSCYDQMLDYYGSENDKTLSCLNSLGVVTLDLGDREKALSLFNECYRLQIEKGGDQNSNALHSLSNIGETYYVLGDFNKALEIWTFCFEKRKVLLGEDSSWTANSLTSIGNAHYSLGNFDEAIKNYNQALQIVEKELGKNNPGTVNILVNLAQATEKAGNLLEAAELWEESSQRLLKMPNSDKDTLLDSLYNAAVCYGHCKKAQKSIECLNACYLLSKKYRGDLNSETLDILSKFCEVLNYFKQYDKALEYLLEYLQILQKTKEDTDPLVLEVLQRIALVHTYLVDYESAANVYRDISKRLEKKHGRDSIEVYEALSVVVFLLQGTEKLDQVLDIAIECYKIGKVIFGGLNNDLLEQMEFIWSLAIRLGKEEEFISLKQNEYEALKTKLGFESYDVFVCSCELSLGYMRSRKYEESLALHQEWYDYYIRVGDAMQAEETKKKIDIIVELINEKNKNG